MDLLATAVIVVGTLCLIDLMLTFGVICRLHEQSVLLSKSPGGEMPVSELSTSDVLGSFTAVTVDGEPMAGPAGLRMAAFFSSSCSACPKRVPAFADYVRANHLRRDDVLAVVLAAPDEPVSYLHQVAEVAMVCVQPADAELPTAFKVTGFPAFCLLDAAGAVKAVSYDPARLPQLSAA